MDLPLIDFDASRARRYRKKQRVLAFRSQDAFTFFKDWGEQHCRPNSWIIVPLSENEKPTTNIYGCDGDTFQETYEAVSDGKDFQYRKTSLVEAYQPGRPFSVRTVLEDGTVETELAQSKSGDGWLVRNPGGEVYPVEDSVFRASYEPAAEDSV